MKIVSSDSMSEIDRQATESFGIPGSLLMENAGIKCWDQIQKYMRINSTTKKEIIVVVGSGNNGGDALVIARQAWISGIRTIKIILVNSRNSEVVSLHKNICEKYGIEILVYGKDNNKIRTSFYSPGIIVDGITGTGLHGALRQSAAEIVQLINLSHAVKISIDIPSGLGKDFKSEYPVIKADLTLTIGLPKTILYYPEMRSFAGEIIIVSIGFPPSLLESPVGAGELFTADDPDLQIIPSWGYKGTRGHAAVFAGSEETPGAAVLAASAAGRARSGLVTLFCDSNVHKIAAPQLKAIMVKKLNNFEDMPSLDNFTSLLAGPGWGRSDRSILLDKFFDSNIPGVLDADGINLLADLENKFQKNPGYLNGQWVFTPHPGEFERLSGVDKDVFMLSPIPYLKKVAEKYGAVLVLKSHVTFIVTPNGDYSIVDGMNPAMGTGGSGDVLAGIITGFLAQGMDSYKSAVSGVVLHQNIGRVCFKEKGWFLAEDLLPYISSMSKKVIADVQ